MQQVTIIIPVFNEEPCISHTLETLDKEFESLTYSPIYLIVDDGSTDKTWDTITKLAKEKLNVTGLSFSRNFGKERAIMAGIRAAKTDFVIVMDADLQHPPENISKLLAKQQETNCDIVHGVKIGRENESSSGGILVRMFYTTYEMLTGVSLAGASDFKLLNRRAIDAYAKMNEKEVFFRGLVPWTGFHQETITFIPAKRHTGITKWNIRNRASTAVKAITSFSTKPLHIITFIGIGFLIGAVGLAAHTLYTWWNGTALEGFTTVVLLLLIIGAALMISLGIIGQYIAHIYDEVRQRPTYIIKDQID